MLNSAQTKTDWSFIAPSIDSYQEQKQIRVIKSKDCHQNIFGLKKTIAKNIDKLSAKDSNHIQWQAFFDARIEAILTEQFPYASKQLALFPGHTVPKSTQAKTSFDGSKTGSEEYYRGSFIIAQFLNLFDFDAKELAYDIFNLPRQKAVSTESWPWLYIEEPSLESFNMKVIADDAIAFACADKKQAFEKKWEFYISLTDACEKMLSDPHTKFADVLTKIHSLWTNTPSPKYSSHALIAAEQKFFSVLPKIDKQNLLAVLFELEALTSYATYINFNKLCFSGIFSGNWLAVGTAPLISIRATEFCVTDRLFDEVINLMSQRFAPIVINEFNSVADGNHRLTSAWLWNLLKYAADCQWSLENSTFQRKVASFFEKFAKNINQISLSEILRHLALFLGDEEKRSRLNQELKPFINNYDFIYEIPVTLLLEYSASAVIKDLYDEGLATIRVSSSLYHAMMIDQSLVLPPRASYHFTDIALLPWFSVLKPLDNNQFAVQEKNNHSFSKQFIKISTYPQYA